MEPLERIAQRIFMLRGKRVMLDADLARLYGVETRALTQAVQRNADRFPADFMFILTNQEITDLRSQIVISSWGGRRSPPRAFTEHGAIMAAAILNSPRVIEVSVYVVRAFVQLRDAFASNRELTRRLNELEVRLERKLSTHDDALRELLAAIRQLAGPPEPPKKRRIGVVQD